MPRARNLKPGFFKNEELVELPFEDRLLFAGLWTLADCRGVLENRPKRIKMEIFPADNVDVAACLDRLEAHGLIQTYERDGIKAIFLPKFLIHQNPHHREKPSDVPGPEAEPEQAHAEPEASPGQAQGKPEASPSTAGLNPESLLLNPESPPSEGADAPPDSKSVVFRHGLALLTGAGRSERAARSHLGKLCKAHGDDAVATAVLETIRAGPVDPAPYLERLCRGESGKQLVDAMTGGIPWS